METPQSATLRPARKHTPRLSARKKSLFAKNGNESEDDLLEGIVPLSTMPDSGDFQSATPKSRGNGNRLSLHSSAQKLQQVSIEKSVPNKEITPLRRSIRVRQRSLSPPSSKSPMPLCVAPTPQNDKENTPITTKTNSMENTEDHLQLLFYTSLRINGQQSPRTPKRKFATREDPTGPDENEMESKNTTTLKRQEAQKRLHPPAEVVASPSLPSPSKSPQKKLKKLSDTKCLDSISIPTKCFYSSSVRKPVISPGRLIPTMQPKRVGPQKSRLSNIGINKGVRHKIRRRQHKSNEKRVRSGIVDVDEILKNLRCEKLRNLIISKREQKSQIEKAHSAFRSNQNPIVLAKPLNALNEANDTNNNNSFDKENPNSSVEMSTEVVDAGFSDLESESEEISDADTTYDKEERVSEDDDAISLQSFANTTSNDDSAHTTNVSNRKFFKSGRISNTKKEVTITNNIKATVCRGKISLLTKKKATRKRIKLKNTVVNEFGDEQATVDAILKNLDDTTFGDKANTELDNVDDASFETHTDDQTVTTESRAVEKSDPSQALSELPSSEAVNNAYDDFRRRLPYNTNDPELVEQQHLLLDFLITSNICTEENFNIFIADPENHKEEAARIVDQLIVVVDEQSAFQERLPYNTNDPQVIAQQQRFLDFLIEHNICTEENFEIFIANYEERRGEAEAIMAEMRNSPAITVNADSTTASNMEIVEACANEQDQLSCEQPAIQQNCTAEANEPLKSLHPQEREAASNLFPIFYPGRCQPLVQKSSRRLPNQWQGGHGANQYQIDAGQKKFGAQQCKQCGLVYSAHEPEEEKLHRDYHASLHLLRFKTWIDEDAVAYFREWGSDGRILRITESSHVKRRERLRDVLEVVDKELGFSSYIIPQIFVAYLAIRKYQIVGLCLVQPLEKAHKYICVNGVDCCTEEDFQAKCGISRIWVSPLHRGIGIATKLIQAVQMNTIFGEEIALDKIAFSAPTESGRIFAQKVTRTENFLVYQ